MDRMMLISSPPTQLSQDKLQSHHLFSPLPRGSMEPRENDAGGSGAGAGDVEDGTQGLLASYNFCPRGGVCFQELLFESQ